MSSPGPWKAKFSGYCYEILDANGVVVCRLPDGNSEEHRENAQLLSHAPDLVAALEEAMKILPLASIESVPFVIPVLHGRANSQD